MAYKSCEWCGDDFIVYGKRINTARFCSKKCLSAHAKKTHTEVCPECGKEFLAKGDQVTCSIKCRNSYAARNALYGYEKCARCRKTFAKKSSAQIYCSKRCADAKSKEKAASPCAEFKFDCDPWGDGLVEVYGAGQQILPYARPADAGLGF